MAFPGSQVHSVAAMAQQSRRPQWPAVLLVFQPFLRDWWPIGSEFGEEREPAWLSTVADTKLDGRAPLAGAGFGGGMSRGEAAGPQPGHFRLAKIDAIRRDGR